MPQFYKQSEFGQILYQYDYEPRSSSPVGTAEGSYDFRVPNPDLCVSLTVLSLTNCSQSQQVPMKGTKKHRLNYTSVHV